MDLKLGEISCRLELPAERVLAIIAPAEPLSGLSSEEIVLSALDDCSEFLDAFRPGEKVVIVTSDITRYTGSDLYLPMLVERLNSRGIPDEDIKIVIALGIHRKQTEAEHRKIVGALYGRIQVVDHECDDPGKLVFIGRTSSGIAVEINRLVAEADRVVLTGTIGFHYFAGFGGGRKSVLPGIASRASCMASHFAVLNPGEGTGKSQFAVTGNLLSNPVHAAMEEACGMVAPDFILNTILSANKKIIAAFGGHWRQAHLAGCDYYRKAFTYPIAGKADLVIVSCGGFPKDINFIQAHKSMEYASHALEEGGVMILLAQCRDGYGHPTFFNWFRFDDLECFERELRRNYEINGQTAYSALQKAKRFRIILVSDLPADEVRTMSMIPAISLEHALTLAQEMLPLEFTAHVIPEGGTILPVALV